MTAPETPGSVPVQVGVTGQFEPVGSTTGSSYIARTHAHRVYEVVAENAAGEASEPSNIQIGPAPEPPSTFASVRAQLRPASGGGSGAFAARAGHASPAARGARRRRSGLVARSPRAGAAAAGAAAADGGLRRRRSRRAGDCAWNGACAPVRERHEHGRSPMNRAGAP